MQSSGERDEYTHEYNVINALMDKGHMCRRVTHEILRPMKFSLKAVVKEDPLAPSIYVCVCVYILHFWKNTNVDSNS